MSLMKTSQQAGIPQEWPRIRSFRRGRCRDVGLAASDEGASIGYQTLWVTSAILRPVNTTPIRRSHFILGPIVGRQRASPEPIGPTTDIELKDKGSESRCGYIPNTKEDSDPQAQKPPANTSADETGCFTLVACTTLSKTHARATKLPMYTCRQVRF